MANTLPGEGTKLQYKVAATYTDIGNVEEIDGPEFTVAAVKTTNLSSTVHTYRASRIPDPGKVSFKLQLDPNDVVHQDLFTRVSTPGVVDEWKIIFMDDLAVPANATFSGFVTKFKISNEKIEENLMAECEIQVTTIPVMTEGAAA